MIKLEHLIIDGETGSGKTYKAIKKAKEIGNFIYLAPCRQLVYETFMKYRDLKDNITTGEVSSSFEIENNNIFGVYESKINFKKYRSIIIDEAHFLNDEERGFLLKTIIEKNKETHNIFLVTATRNFRILKGFKILKLKSLYNFKKKQVSIGEFYKRLNAGEPSIIFRRTIRSCGYDGGVEITSKTPAHERLKHQIAFGKGEIKLIECTNVLAQGLNFPATNILIEKNFYDTDETILQKIGRLGRFGVTNKDALLTYSIYGNVNKKIKKSKLCVKKNISNLPLSRLKDIFRAYSNKLSIANKEYILTLKSHEDPFTDGLYSESIIFGKYNSKAIEYFKRVFRIENFEEYEEYLYSVTELKKILNI